MNVTDMLTQTTPNPSNVISTYATLPSHAAVPLTKI